MKLLKMTDYVLEQTKYPKGSKYYELYKDETIEKIHRYAKFLKQPLKLEMFVPCLGYGEPFNEFQLETLNSHDEVPELRLAYKKSKENIFFEGLYWEGNYAIGNMAEEMIYIDEEFCQNMTIEDFLNTIISEIKLTQSAINQING